MLKFQQCFLLPWKNEKERDLERGRCLRETDGRLGLIEENNKNLEGAHGKDHE